MIADAEELVFTSRSINISAKAWGQAEKPLIIALHGWLDNSGSFDQLVPLLTNKYYVVALDLPGQGYSDKRGEGCTYHLWDDMVDVKAIIDQLGKPSISLLGHSRGAMLSVMLTASFPELVKSIFLIDGLVPLPEKLEHTPRQLRQYVSDFLKEPAPRRFETREDAIAIRAKAGRIEEALAEVLAKRQLKQDEAGWYWDVDDRLRHASAVKMTDQHNEVLLNSLTCPVSIFLATQGMGTYPKMLEYQKRFDQFDWFEVQGHHHLHMTKSGANEIAEKILVSS